MLNILKKLFGSKENLEIESFADSPAEESFMREEKSKPIAASSPPNSKNADDTSEPELLLDFRDYKRPDPANFNTLGETFKSIIKKPSFENIPFLWSSKSEDEFQDLKVLKNIIVAGTQSTGKTNFINQFILSILFSKDPYTIKLIIADSKGLELGQYEKLLNNFLTTRAGEKDIIAKSFSSVVETLTSLCIAMDQRYDLLVKAKVKNIDEYNTKLLDGVLEIDSGHYYLPSLVLIIDDFGSYSYRGSSEIFQPYLRILTQGYKVGIFSVITTSQTGNKAIPADVLSLIGSRVVFRLNNREDYWKFFETTRVEIPLQRGAFLYKENNHVQVGETKYHHPESIEEVVEAVAKQRVFKYPFLLPGDNNKTALEGKDFDLSDRDSLFDDAARLIVQSQSGSTSLLQRRMKLGYNRAGRLMNQLEAAGIVGPDRGSKVRDVLIKTEKDLIQQLNKLG